MKKLICTLLWYLALSQFGAFGQVSEAVTLFNKGEAARESKNFAEAKNYYQKAAELGNAEAQYMLGNWYACGFQVPQSASLGEKWLTKAVEGGNNKAMVLLADLYRCGIDGFVRDMNKAFFLMSKAAELGNLTALHSLGDYYSYGWGVAEDRSKAVNLYQRAFDAGNLNAGVGLGYAYRSGKGVEKDSSKAAYYFRRAAEGALELSTNNLYTPSQISSWEKTAFIYYEYGAQCGDAESCMTLAKMYETGKGCTRNSLKAKEWREKGAMATKASITSTPKPEIPALATVDDGTFSSFAKPYIEAAINQWQKKGEFEKTTTYQTRVNQATRDAKIADLLKKAEQQYLAEKAKAINLKAKMQLEAYDADHETYRITRPGFDNIILSVPLENAFLFKTEWNRVAVEPEYCVKNDRLALRQVGFTMPNGAKYVYGDDASSHYSVVRVEYNFDPVEINIQPNNSQTKNESTIKQIQIAIGKSDVDINIPIESIQNDKTFAVIIANEEYMQLSKVPFALNDSKVFGEYCRKTLGLPEPNIRYYSNATYGVLLSAIRDIRNIAESYPEGIKVLFYYVGHGAPHEATKQAYLIPIDADGVNMQGCYALDDLYRELGSLNARSVVAFMDACFSGAARDGQMLASARGVSLVPKNSVPQGKLVVFSAASNDETALPYTEQGHGLFTYFLLKKLQETKGNVTLGELGDYVVTNVRQKSNVVNRKNQTPTITPSASIAQGWQSISLK